MRTKARPESRHVRVAVLVGALTLLAVADAQAFRPTARWVLDRAVAFQLDRKVRSLKVEQSTTLYGIATAPRGLNVQQRTWLLSPGNLREEVELPEGTATRVHTPKMTLTRAADGKERKKRASPDLVAAILGCGPPVDRAAHTDKLVKLAERLKVDIEVVSYGRFDGRVAYVIGAKPWEEKKPQIWIDKDRLLLLRVVAVSGKGESAVVNDTRLLGWGSPEGGEWYPKVVEKWSSGKLQSRAVTRSVDKNQRTDAALFEIR
jgi:hypothetical protein